MAFRKVIGTVSRIGFGLLATGVGVTQFFFTIDAGECALLFDRFQGIKPKLYQEGMHFRIPFIQTPRLFETRARPRVIYTICVTKDRQIAYISLRILFRPDAKFMSEIFLTLGDDYEHQVVPSEAKEVLKAIAAKYTSVVLLTDRRRISAEIKMKLAKRLANFHILLDDVAVTHMRFGKEFTQAMKDKQIAIQNKKRYKSLTYRMKYVTEKREQLKKATILHAKGEAESAELMKEIDKKAAVGN